MALTFELYKTSISLQHVYVPEVLIISLQHISVPEVSDGLGPGPDGRLHSRVPLRVLVAFLAAGSKRL